MNKKNRMLNWCILSFLIVVNFISSFTYKINNKCICETYNLLNNYLLKLNI